MYVGADGIWGQSLRYSRLYYLNVTVDASMAHVHDYPPVGGGPDFGPQFAIPVQDGLVVSVERMGRDVSRPQKLQHIRQGYWSTADMHHETGFGLVSNGAG